MATSSSSPAVAPPTFGDRVPPDSPWAKYVWVDAGRMSGEPCFRDTRVPIRILFDHVRAGDSLKEFLDGFDGVTREQAVGVIDLMSHELIHRLRIP